MTVATKTKQPLWFIANRALVHVDGEESDGAYDLVEIAGRQGDMPPLHVHHEHDETFYVLEGRLSLHLPGRSVELDPGESFLAPRGVPHEHLQRRLDTGRDERGSGLVEIRPQILLDRTRAVGADLDRVEAVLACEADLVDRRPPVEREEPPHHPDAHG